MFKRVHGLLALSVILASGGILLAQTAGTGSAASQPAKKPGDLKITLMDGSVLAGKLSVPELAIDTKYGSLKVPVDQIQSFMPGLNSHPAFQSQIDQYVNDLAADTFSDREKAQQALLKIGPDIRGELERLAKSAEAEKANRLQVILDDFNGQGGEDEAPKTPGWIKEDVIVTPGFTVVGRITTGSFSVSSAYGTLNLKIEDVRQAARDIVEREDIRKNVTVPGQNFANHTYTSTGLRLAKGDQVIITASGSIMLTPWSQQANPDGGTNIGSINTSNGSVTAGTLIGRMGDSGQNFKIGSKYTFTVDKPGILNLGIAAPGSYEGNSFPGEYAVKIRVVKK